jgi:hypothetical protein
MARLFPCLFVKDSDSLTGRARPVLSATNQAGNHPCGFVVGCHNS